MPDFDAETTWSITVIERDDDVVYLMCRGRKGTVGILTNIIFEGARITLWNFHIEGPGPGAVGVADLRALGRALGRQFGVQTVIVHGFERSTGANPKRRPRPIVIEVQ